MAQRLTPRQRQQRAREEILEAAARAIAHHGFHGMTMRELARATGRSLANFYNYFESKDEVLFALHTRAFETLIEHAQDMLARSSDPAGQLYLFIASHVGYVLEHPDIMRVLIQEASALAPEERQAVRTLKERYFHIARGIVQALLEAAEAVSDHGGGSVLDEADLDRSTYSIFGMLNWLYGWYDPAQHGSPDHVNRTLHRMALGGLVARFPEPSSQQAMEERFSGVSLPPLIGVAEGGLT